MKRANAMRAKAIKVKLAAMGVGTKDLFEKEELARALAKAWSEQLEGTVTLPLRQLVGMPGNPRAGYVVVSLGSETTSSSTFSSTAAPPQRSSFTFRGELIFICVYKS